MSSPKFIRWPVLRMHAKLYLKSKFYKTDMILNACSLSVAEIVGRLNTSLSNGLNAETVKKGLELYGRNQIPKDRPKGKWHILLDQLLNPIIYILTVAVVLALLFGNWLEGIAVLVVILISTSIGFFMEFQAMRSLEVLRKMGQVLVRVVRSGKTKRIQASELVPGDIVLLQTGDVVGADSRLVSEENLAIKESALTGESFPVAKNTDLLPTKTPIAEQRNMVFKGTIVTSGSGMAIVTSIGRNTQLGRIQQMGIEARRQTTPLEKKLNQLSKWLIWFTLFLAVLIVITGYVRGKDLLLMIETGVALAIATIPEGLPIVATIALARGMLRLSKKEVIIKNLEAVQTLGATNVIFTDKTGTLTEDQMKVHTVLLSEATVGHIGQSVEEGIESIKGNMAFEQMMLASILCNNADLSKDGLRSDSIEVALLDFALLLSYDIGGIQRRNPERFELPFDADRKFMATAHENRDGYLIYVKGAFEKLVEASDFFMDNGIIKKFDQKEAWFTKVDKLASQGLRTLAFAYQKTKELPQKEAMVKDLVFLGVMGFIDPARTDVRPIMDIYKRAGIKVIMATGDHPKTAKKIAEEIGLLAIGSPAKKVLQGKDLQRLERLDKGDAIQLSEASVFARVTPGQKLGLISFHQKKNHIVGMIGDGINDVPALKKADIGMAMGIRGTEAAREVAEVILKNDKFSAI